MRELMLDLVKTEAALRWTLELCFSEQWRDDARSMKWVQGKGKHPESLCQDQIAVPPAGQSIHAIGRLRYCL
jgi:hypothetical protein